MNLSDNEKRDTIKLIQEGKPLPEKYRFLLFDDNREVELLWNGKTNEVTNTVLPFQVIEQIDEPRGEDKIGLQESLFDTSGRQIVGWTNKLIWGDNKLILSSLKNGPLKKEIEAQGGLKLIYIDPPFDVGADFSMDIKIGDGEEEESFTKKPSVIEEIAYRDTWGKGADSFIAMIYERLKLSQELLSEDGAIYVHCDYRLNSAIRLVMDEIFGRENFVNEIIWSYRSGGASKKESLPRKHDSILFYRKSENFKVNTQYERQYLEKQFIGTLKDDAGRWYVDTILRDVFEGLINIKEGNNIITYNTRPVLNVSFERNDYPTQKPEGLIELLMILASQPNDLIADFFCGSGTTLAVAEKLGRKWIGSDLGKFGIHTTRKRMIGVQRELKKVGKNFRAFEILNMGRYEKQYYVGAESDQAKDSKTRKDKEFVELILAAYKAEPIDSAPGFHGKKRDRLVVVGPIDMPVSSSAVESVVKWCKTGGFTKVDVLGFDYEMGIDFGEAKQDGIDIVFKIIPREVFDKKAVEKGQVKFYDVAFIEVNPIVKGRVGKKELSIELTDFSVFYNQDDSGEVLEALRPGGTKVVVENGQVVKVTKDKTTEEISKEVLTKKWSDWIDYWAVDFNFADRKEIINILEDGIEKELWTGDYIFDNEWQSFRTKKDRNLELTSAAKEVFPGTHKVAIKIVDIFGNDTTKVIEVSI